MKIKQTKLMYFVLLLIPALAVVTSACGTANASTLPPTETVTYKEFTLPFPEDISFELPDTWDFWANAGYLSPDDGRTYAGVRLVWIEEGRDAEEALYNEGSTVHEKSTVMIGDLETQRYIVEVILTSASTNEVISHTYELIHAFPSPNGEMMAGVVFSAPSREELEQLVPVAEHMVETLMWGSGD